jgi:hypothetical protein
MALVTMTEAARQLGYASRSQLRRLRDEGRIDDFRRKIGGRELIETDGLHDHIASIIGQRSSGNVCIPNRRMDDWQQIADVVNEWLKPECWKDHPFTAQQLATLSVCIRDAAGGQNHRDCGKL